MSKPKSETAFAAAKAERDTHMRDVRRQAILQGAWKVFVRDGLDGATIRAIAAASGCTTGAVYPLFGSKELIYAAMLSQSLFRLHGAVAAAMADRSQPHHRLRAGAHAFVDYYRNRSDEVALGLYLWNGIRPRGLTRELDRDLNRQLTMTLDLLGEALVEVGVARGASTRRATAALFSVLIGALVVAQTGRLRMLGSSLDDVVESQLELLLSHQQKKKG